MSYLSEHYYKMMRLLPSSDGKSIALKTRYQKDRIKEWWLDEENFIENWAKPAIQRVIDEEINKMVEDALDTGDISVKLNVWKM